MRKCSAMVSEMRRTLPQLPPFNWQREYAHLWEGRNEGHLNDILFGPGPEDVLMIDGVRDTWQHHQQNARPPLLHRVNECGNCHIRPKMPDGQYCRQCYDMKYNSYFNAARKGRVQ